MISVSICDDDTIMLQTMKKIVENELQHRKIGFECNIYTSGEEFLKLNKKTKNELIILDIEMPGISGLKIAEHLKNEGRNKNIVFATSHENLVFRSLQCYPFSFIRKSNIEIEIPEMIEQFLKQNAEKHSYFAFETKKSAMCIPVENIMYLTYWDHKIILVTNENRKYEFRGAMKECLSQLKGEHFFRANSGAIVNLKYGKKLEDSCILMKDNSRIQISRERKKECKQRFMKCWRESI